ncbi:hypothetical protein ANANG_G00187080, partial [Anguilla anguilla]
DRQVEAFPCDRQVEAFPCDRQVEAFPCDRQVEAFPCDRQVEAFPCVMWQTVNALGIALSSLATWPFGSWLLVVPSQLL